MQVSQTISPGGQRAQIAIPAQGLVEFRNAITDILVEHFIKKTGSAAKVFEPTKLNVENKNFYFDIGENNREIYMRISE
ncbi:PURA, partial [Cordylochernes scorpioides]